MGCVGQILHCLLSRKKAKRGEERARTISVPAGKPNSRLISRLGGAFWCEFFRFSPFFLFFLEWWVEFPPPPGKSRALASEWFPVSMAQLQLFEAALIKCLFGFCNDDRLQLFRPVGFVPLGFDVVMVRLA